MNGEPVLVAVSGGADSLALLGALDELLRSGRLKLKLAAAHLDHGLRGERGAEDARWVAEHARSLGYECFTGRADVAGRAAKTRDNLEQAARRARYEFLRESAARAGACAVLTAHTLDDQAETVILRLVRGSGAEGLSGMAAERELEKGSSLKLRRPLLGWARRADTEEYCRERGLDVREDAMNDDESFARVRVRRRVTPLLESFNPRAVEAVARSAELLRADASLLDALAARLLEEARVKPAANDESEPRTPSPLRVEALAGAHEALRLRALRLWLREGRGDLRRIEMSHVRAVERLLSGARGGRVAELPGGFEVERRRGTLSFRRERVENPVSDP